MTTVIRVGKRLVMPLMLVSVVIMSALGTASAQTEVYGQIRLSLDNSRANGTHPVAWKFDDQGNVINRGDRVTGMKDQGSRLGLIGQEALEAFTLIYHLEWGFNAATSTNDTGGFTQRLEYLTLKNEYGALTVGKIENPFKHLEQFRVHFIGEKLHIE